MSEEKIKVLFPDDVETITISKNDYDRLYGEMTYKNIVLQEKLEKYKNIVDDIDKYIHSFKIEDIGEKTMLILNDILLIKNGLGKDVIRLDKLNELKGENK